MRNSDSCAKKATVMDIEIGIQKEKDETADAIQIPRGMIRGGHDQKSEIRMRVDALMIIVRGEGIKRMSGGRDIATHGRAHQIGGGTDIDTMRDDAGQQISGLYWGIEELYQMLINEL